MNELMVHVERIVRPIAATENRKLHMRMELLDHLQAALDEEHHYSLDGPDALERAKQRLGEPFELTKKLQQSVPFLQRALLTRFLVMPRSADLEQRVNRIAGIHGNMTLGHKAILAGVAHLALTPLLICMYIALSSSGMQAKHPFPSFVATAITWLVLLCTSYRFVFASAKPVISMDWSDLLMRGMAILALQIGLTFFNTLAIANRHATLAEVGICVVCNFAFLAVSTAVGGRIAAMRRRYDEWLTLEIAECT